MVLVFGVAAENLVYLVWRNENFIATGKQAEIPQLEEQIQEFNQRMTDAIQSAEEIE